LTRFRHPAVVAVDDLLYLAVSISDNTAGDALFDLTPPAVVHAELRRLGLDGISVRHRLADLTTTPAERFGPGEQHLAHELAVKSGTAIAQLDVTRANAGTARAYADLLSELWRPTMLNQATAARMRQLMADNIVRHRLSPDFTTDASRWSSKTGTLLNLRHEAGVVDHANGQSYAVVALTESTVPAATQPAAESLIARTARTLRDALRTSGRH
jgi:beta-lactamase class A